MKPEIINDMFSLRVGELLKKYNMSNLMLCGILDLKPSSVSELLAGRSNWMLHHVVNIALYFGENVEYLIFGDSEYTKKHKAKSVYEAKQNIRNFLVKEKKHTTLGKLEADGFFNELKEQ